MPEKTTDQSAIRPAIGVFLRHPTESLLSPRKISGFYDFHQLKSDRLLEPEDQFLGASDVLFMRIF